MQNEIPYVLKNWHHAGVEDLHTLQEILLFQASQVASTYSVENNEQNIS